MTESAEHPSGIALAAGERWGSTAVAPDRVFWLALTAAALLHAALFVRISSALPRPAGDVSGVPEAISVAIVTDAELRAMTAVPEPASPPPGPVSAAKDAEPVTPPPAAPPEQVPEQPPVEPSPVETMTKPEPDIKLQPTITEALPEIVAGQGAEAEAQKAGEKPGEKLAQEKAEPKPQPTPPAKAKPKPPQPQRDAKLDLSPPKPSFAAPSGGGGRSAGFERPPGITRSGANDEFARRVIQALQSSMPQLRDTLGRVTVRIILNDNGNVVDVQVVRPSQVPGLNQNVVFAAKQTSYPFPPPNSNEADRVFLVTYIYN